MFAEESNENKSMATTFERTIEGSCQNGVEGYMNGLLCDAMEKA
jgi:hypothetical protein